ncbi:MAG: DUF1127 domain-containing protein [Acidobacteriaceae bacterium]|nr:DUF1127 domain-containing protein [Acidobacteriaceae bacterium]
MADPPRSSAPGFRARRKRRKTVRALSALPDHQRPRLPSLPQRSPKA